MEAPNDAALRLYVREIKKALSVKLEQLEKLQYFASQIADTTATVTDLPKRLSHNVLVPFGKHAFFQGTLKHTNEITLHLGADYYVQCTAQHASEILERRQQVAGSNIKTLEAEIQGLKDRLGMASTEIRGKDTNQESKEAPEGSFEIRETVEESDALLASAHHHSNMQRGTREEPIAKGHGSLEGSKDNDRDFDQLFRRIEELERLEDQTNGDDETLSASSLSGSQPLPGGCQDTQDTEAWSFDAFAPVPLLSTGAGILEHLEEGNPSGSGRGRKQKDPLVPETGPSITEKGPSRSVEAPKTSSTALKKGFFGKSTPKAKHGPTSDGAAEGLCSLTERLAFSGLVKERETSVLGATNPNKVLSTASVSRVEDGNGGSSKRVSKFKQQMQTQK